MRAGARNGTGTDPLIRSARARRTSGRDHALQRVADLTNTEYRAARPRRIHLQDLLGDLASQTGTNLRWTSKDGRRDRRGRAVQVQRVTNLYLYTRADTIYGGTNQLQRKPDCRARHRLPKERRGTLRARMSIHGTRLSEASRPAHGKARADHGRRGTGIGFAAAKRLLEEGARVFISDMHQRRLAEAAAKISEAPVPRRRPASRRDEGEGRARAVEAALDRSRHIDGAGQQRGARRFDSRS